MSDFLRHGQTHSVFELRMRETEIRRAKNVAHQKQARIVVQGSILSVGYQRAVWPPPGPRRIWGAFFGPW